MVQIFLAHSSQDSWFIDPIAENLRSINVDPYLAELDAPNPESLYDKLKRAILGSTAIFLILTHNVMKRLETRHVVDWEIATAKAYDKPVYVFRERDVEIPILISQLFVHVTFDPFNKRSMKKAMTRIVAIASKFKELKESEDLVSAAAIIIMIALGIVILAAIFARK